MSVVRNAKAVWHGGGRIGVDNLATDSGLAIVSPCQFKSRLEDGKGINPDNVMAAPYARNFTAQDDRHNRHP
jgi:hypothetical protein